MIQVLRKEKKYILPRRAAMELERQLSGVMQLDTNGVEGRYFIRSQYFDSLTDGDLQDNLAGLWEKSKLRLRIYSLDDPKAKLEWKRKFGLDSRKSSLTVTRAQALQMERGDAAFLLDMDSQLARQIYCRFTAGAYRPKTIVEYQRKALLYPAGDVRITFDTDIRGSVCPWGLFEPLVTFPITGNEYVLMEVKYSELIPQLLVDILHQADSLQTSNSKYLQARLLNL